MYLVQVFDGDGRLIHGVMKPARKILILNISFESFGGAKVIPSKFREQHCSVIVDLFVCWQHCIGCDARWSGRLANSKLCKTES